MSGSIDGHYRAGLIYLSIPCCSPMIRPASFFARANLDMSQFGHGLETHATKRVLSCGTSSREFN